MTVVHWRTGISGDFETASDWSTGTIPGPGDNVFIDASGSYTVTSTSAETFASVFVASGATWEVSAPEVSSLDLVGTPPNFSFFLGGTGICVNNGSILIDSSSALTIADPIENSGLIEVTGYSERVGPDDFVHQGRLSLDPQGGSNTGAIKAEGGSVIITLAIGPLSPFVSFTNYGTIEAGPDVGSAQSDVLVVSAIENPAGSIEFGNIPFTNVGQLVIDGGHMEIDAPVVGTGVAAISENGTLELRGSTFANDIVFGAGGGTLELGFGSAWADNRVAASVTGNVSDFGAGDAIDLVGLSYGSNTVLSYAPNEGSSGGSLTVSNGVYETTISLAGIYSSAGFHLANDGSGNAKITYSAPPPILSEYFVADRAVYPDNSLGAAFTKNVSGMTLVLDSNDPKVQGHANWLSDGFFGQAFQDPNGNVLISFEGTVLNLDPFSQTPFEKGALGADLDIFKGITPQAFRDALEFTKDVLQDVVASNEGSALIYLTGHSLGGAEAEFVAAMDHESGLTFGAPGDNDFSNSSAAPGQNFINYVDYADPIGNFKSSDHFGTVENVGSKIGGRLANYLDHTALGLAFLAATASGYHSLEHYQSDFSTVELNSAPIVGTETASAALSLFV